MNNNQIATDHGKITGPQINVGSNNDIKIRKVQRTSFFTALVTGFISSIIASFVFNYYWNSENKCNQAKDVVENVCDSSPINIKD